MTQYVMDNRFPAESRRLALLEAWADAGTVRCLDTVGVGPGWSCLEVGAGGGSIARWLCNRVGLEGRVVATDIDCRLLDSLHGPNLEVRQHDIVFDSLEEGAFDLVHARMVLEHLPARTKALRKMASSLKAGGWLIVEDQDLASVVLACEADAEVNNLFMKRSSALVDLLTAVGVDLQFGRRLHVELQSQKLVDVCSEGRVSVVAGGSPLAQFWRMTWEQLRPLLIASGPLTQGDVDEIVALLDDPTFVWVAPTIMAAWGRRQVV